MKSLLRTREIWLAFAIIAIVMATSMRAPNFVSFANLGDIFNNTAMLMILALGQMVVILTRSIDLSMAANLALTGMIVALINAAFPSFPVPILMILATFCGLALGAFNGILVWKLGIPAIVVTLGTLTIFRGTIFLIAGGKWVNADQLSSDFIQMTRFKFLELPLLSWFAIIIALIFYITMTRTPLGRSLTAIGINPTASVYAGINVGKNQVHFILHVWSCGRFLRLFVGFTLCHRLG